MINLPVRYAKVIKTFNNGGMSDTLLCEDSHLQRRVIIKSLKAGIEASKLIDELAALSSIRSKYVVQVLDVIVDGGQPVGFVEEFLPGNELNPCDPASTTPLDALKALYPIAAGIADIHAHQRVHRDIKPDNMRYDAEGQLKIFDFGLAKLDSSPGTKVLYYTEGFTAPESFLKDSSGLYNYDYPIDVYAFGCVAIWLLNSGNLPPELKSLTPSLPHNFDFQKLPVSLNPDTSTLLLRCLSNDPTQRPTMAECRDHLAAELLRDQHKMTLSSPGGTFIVDKNNPNVTIKGNSSEIRVHYDGIKFTVGSFSGNVTINNAIPYVGQPLSGAMVIVLRRPSSYALSVTCDVSHPEVTL